jgi:hypothetical protein
LDDAFLDTLPMFREVTARFYLTHMQSESPEVKRYFNLIVRLARTHRAMDESLGTDKDWEEWIETM